MFSRIVENLGDGRAERAWGARAEGPVVIFCRSSHLISTLNPKLSRLS